MTSDRKTAIIVGILFIMNYLGVFIGSAIYTPVINAPDLLGNIFTNKTQLMTGMAFELMNDAAVIGIVVMLFPILKKYSESLALGLVGFRFMEAAMLVVGKISILSLITTSREYVEAGTRDAACYQVIGASALAEHYWAGQMTTVFFILGALIFYYILYQSKLLPRFISVWGFLAVASLTTANVVGVPEMNQGFHPAMILFLPIVLNELFLGTWLIAKGFNPHSIASDSAKNR